MKKILLVVAGVSACVLLACGPALSSGEAEQRKSVSEKADTDKDGKVTLEESTARRKVWFGEMDKDNDGKVTPMEFMSGTFERTDTNEDGVIDRQEYVTYFAGPGHEQKGPVSQILPSHKAGLLKNEYIDQDKNGYIDSNECADHYNGYFETIDTNKDGKIEAEEFAASRVTLCGELDANGRGYITVEDMVVPEDTEKTDNKI